MLMSLDDWETKMCCRLRISLFLGEKTKQKKGVDVFEGLALSNHACSVPLGVLLMALLLTEPFSMLSE